jgi:UPF0716 family protein affecting phage T7 exclusion
MLLPANFQSSHFSTKNDLIMGWEEEFFVVAGSLMTAPGFQITTILPLTLVLVFVISKLNK